MRKRVAIVHIEEPPKGYKINPVMVETKSRRVQIIMQPSLYRKAKLTADYYGLSMNEFINTAVEEFINQL